MLVFAMEYMCLGFMAFVPFWWEYLVSPLFSGFGVSAVTSDFQVEEQVNDALVLRFEATVCFRIHTTSDTNK